MDYANFSTIPPFHNRQNEPFYDEGQGIPVMNQNNMTEQDIYRTPFVFTQTHKTEANEWLKAAEKTISHKSDLGKIFFSDANMKRIQKKIKQAVLIKTDYKFCLDVDQDEQDLLLAMSAVYKLKARNLPGQTVRQVKRLNTDVVEYVVPDIITNIKQYYGYIKEINEPLKPIDRPVNVNNAGRSQLPSMTTVWGL